LGSSFSALETIGAGWIIAAALSGYILGSIPFGLIFTLMAGKGDVRKIGSGNTGATNVLRTGSKKLAALTLLCDLAKGALPAACFSLIAFNLSAFAGFCAVVGHIFPVWLKFKGGKGVATYLGVLLAVAWWLALCAVALWLLCAYISRYSSLSALVAAFFAPVIAAFTLPAFTALLIALMSLLVFFRHRGNIARLLAGAESRIKL